MRTQFIITCLVLCLSGSAQPYTGHHHTRHRFAQFTPGISFRQMGNNNPGQFSTGENSSLEVLLGGTHFWGHADFLISIPVIKFKKDGLSSSVELAGRWFPWEIKSGKVRPFAGVALHPVHFRLDDGPVLTKFSGAVTSGLVLLNGKNWFELGIGCAEHQWYSYPLSRLTSTEIRIQPVWLSVGYRWFLETTLSAEKGWLSGNTAKLTDTLAERGKLNGITVSLGPSSAIFLKRSMHNKAVLPHLDDHHSCTILPDVGLGYYFHKPDIQVNLAYRIMKSDIHAFGDRQEITREALTLESFRFIFDYHGFAFFAGPSLSREHLCVKEWLNNHRDESSFSGFRPGITFGWDIRPNRIQSWYLRTNLRWFPGMSVVMPDVKSVSFDQLEFNYIQLVIFPARIF